MSLKIKIKSGEENLLDEINKKIKIQAIVTWICDSDGDFTLAHGSYIEEAWMHPNVINKNNELVFGIIGRKDKQLSSKVYAYYHSKLLEVLLLFFDTKIDSIEISSIKDYYDRFM